MHSASLGTWRKGWRSAALCSSWILAAAGTHASASAWVKVADLTDGDVLYANASASQGPTVALTTLLVYARPQLLGQGSAVLATQARWELRCSDGQYRNLAFTTHAGKTADSPVVAQHSQPSDWSTAPPESMPGRLLRWACKP